MAFDTDVYFKGAPANLSPAQYAQMGAQTDQMHAQTQKINTENQQAQQNQSRQQTLQQIASKYQGPNGFDQTAFQAKGLGEYVAATGDVLGAQKIQTNMNKDLAEQAKYRNETQKAWLEMDKAAKEKAQAEAQAISKATSWIKEGGPEAPMRWDSVAKENGLDHLVGQYDPQKLELLGFKARTWQDVASQNAAQLKADQEAEKWSEAKPMTRGGKTMMVQTQPQTGQTRELPYGAPPNATAIMMAGGGQKVDPTQPLPDVGMEAIAQAIARKEQPPQEYSVRNPAGKIINARAATIGEGQIMGKSAQATRQSGLKDFEPQGTSGKTISAINTMTEHLATGKRLAEALNSGDMPTINKLGQSLGIQMGDNKATNFNTLKQFLSGEVAKVATGGHITEGEIHAAAERLNSASSPAQLLGALDVMKEVAGGKLIALDQDYKRLSGKGLVEGKRLTPATVKAFESVGAHGGEAPTSAKPPTKVNPADGKTYFLHSDGKYYSTKG